MRIENYPLRDTVNTGIQYSRQLESVRAAIWAGATLDELKKWTDGVYPRSFQALVIAAYRADGWIHNHSEDAVTRASERKSKRGR